METHVGEDDTSLGREMLRFTRTVDQLGTADAVLDRLHQVSFGTCKLNALGALLLPVRWGDLGSLARGKTVFLHSSTPEGWWEEWIELSRQHPGPGLTLIPGALAPITMTEMMRLVEPLGTDRWPFELALKHGVRDQLICPVGGRWVVVYWSRYDLSKRLTPEARALLFMGATFAAIRLQKVVGSDVARVGSPARLTPRELAVLRWMSIGHQVSEAAQSLQLGAETVRTHLKKAQSKLGVHNRTHAVAQALRLRLIP
ncbi:MAG: helix-turn-helix transcriptional regulator [Hyphomicrobiaceae bacterium]|nr:helix-turn-helix transcriptional regulator [Hyphomicrobiaceae bacterium]